MLNAKLTATGRYSVRLLSFQLVSLFPFSPISSCYRSIVILFPHFYAILFRTNGETKKTGRIKPAWGGWRWSERERGAVGDGGKELQVSRPAASRWISNYSFRLLRDFHHKATSKRQYIYISIYLYWKMSIVKIISLLQVCRLLIGILIFWEFIE